MKIPKKYVWPSKKGKKSKNNIRTDVQLKNLESDTNTKQSRLEVVGRKIKFYC